jgi:hypothetical protein
VSDITKLDALVAGFQIGTRVRTTKATTWFGEGWEGTITAVTVERCLVRKQYAANVKFDVRFNNGQAWWASLDELEII